MTPQVKPDSSTATEIYRLFKGITVTKPRKYLRHYQYVIYRMDLPAVQVTVLNKEFDRLRCKGHVKIIRMTEEIRRNIRIGEWTNDLEPDSTTLPELDYLFDGIVVPNPKKYLRHYQYVIYRENLPAIKVTILNKQLARLRCKGYEKIVRMAD